MEHQEKIRAIFSEALASLPAMLHPVATSPRQSPRRAIDRIWRQADRLRAYDLLRETLDALHGRPTLMHCSPAQLRIVESVLTAHEMERKSG